MRIKCLWRLGFIRYEKEVMRELLLSSTLILLWVLALPSGLEASGSHHACTSGMGLAGAELALLERSQDSGWVAVVNGVSSGKRYVEALKKRGYQVIHISTYPGGSFPEMWRDSFDPGAYDAHLDYEASRASEVLEQLRHLGVKAVIPASEEAPAVAEWLAAELGLRVNGLEDEDRLDFLNNPRRNKYEMIERVRDFLAEQKSLGRPVHGRVAEQIGTTSWTELWWWKTQVFTDWPVIVKPVLSSGQDSIYKCFDMSCLRRAFDAILNQVNLHGHANDKVLVQEFIEGHEFIVETMSAGEGSHFGAYTWQYEAVPVPGTSALTHVANLLPVSHPLSPSLFQFAFEVNEALGIRWGSGHHEMIITPGGEIVLVETGSRLAGGDMPYWVREATGIDEVNLSIDAYVRPDLLADRWALIQARYEQMPPKHLSEVLLLSLKEGRVLSRQAEEDIRELASFQSLSWRYQEGEPVGISTNLRTVLAYVVLIHEDPEVLKADRLLLKRWEQEGRFTRSL